MERLRYIIRYTPIAAMIGSGLGLNYVFFIGDWPAIIVLGLVCFLSIIASVVVKELGI